MATKQTRRSRPRRVRTAEGERILRTLNEFVPPAARTHLRQARREVLLAIRDVLDHAIARAETAARARRLRRVRVE
ncbi:MAG TPA: hypothetical protein VKZ50_00790 [bacterium]|nr:hypothetical protein [bacterium]